MAQGRPDKERGHAILNIARGIVGDNVFSWLAATSKNLHVFLGPLFLVCLAYFIVLFARDNMPRRYERDAPGELLHLDIRKLGRIGRIGHRITGDRRDRMEGHRLGARLCGRR